MAGSISNVEIIDGRTPERAAAAAGDALLDQTRGADARLCADAALQLHADPHAGEPMGKPPPTSDPTVVQSAGERFDAAKLGDESRARRRLHAPAWMRAGSAKRMKLRQDASWLRDLRTNAALRACARAAAPARPPVT